MHRWIVVLAVILGSAATARAQDPGTVTASVTLDEAIRRALDIQPAMVAARGASRSSDASVRAATGAFLPSVSVGGSAARAGGFRLNNQIELAAVIVIADFFDLFQRIIESNH